MAADSIGRLCDHAESSTLRATAVLQRTANMPRRAASHRRFSRSIHSDMSKLDFPVRASIPRRLSMLDFAGRFVLPREPRAAFVTHGGFPKTRMGSGSVPTRADQSVSKKSL